MDSKTDNGTVPVAEVVARAIDRCEDARLNARVRSGDAEWGSPGQVAELVAVRRSFEREARWWKVLLRGTGYGDVPDVFRRAVIRAYARAEDFAERYARHEQAAREAARQQQERGRAA